MIELSTVKRSSKMVNGQPHFQLSVKEYFMENMFCAPRGMLGRIGGQLMALDRWLPVWVLDLLEIDPSDSVLEVGSGPGVGLALAASRTLQGRVVGVDASATMLSVAERRNRAWIEAGRAELRLGTAEKLPFDDATFDKAMTINSLHLWPDPVAGLREVRRTLRRGGSMAVAITRFSYASPDKFDQLLSESGFTEVKTYAGEAGSCAIGHT
jgi:ubiquinone/menaquinone biosynthesis C-methylase UbiE